MAVITEGLQRYAEAISDPTRGMIILELDEAGELTATQLAQRLDLTANNVFHHMRVLSRLGVVETPRIVPGPTYVEKYYHLNPEIRAAIRLDRTWLTQAQDSLTAEDLQAIVVSSCLAMSHLLQRAARAYRRMDPQVLDHYVREKRLLMQCIRRVSREELKGRMEAVWKALEEADPKFAEDTDPRTDLMLIAALPFLSGEDE